MQTTLCAFIAALVHLRFVFASFLLRTSLPGQPQSPAWAIGRIWFGLMTLTSSRCSQAEIRHLCPTTVFSWRTSLKEVRALSELSVTTTGVGARGGGWMGFKRNQEWTFKENTVQEPEGEWGSWMGVIREINEPPFNTATLNINIKDGKPEKGNLDRLRDSEQKLHFWDKVLNCLASPSVWCCLYRVWCLSHGCRKLPAPWVFRRKYDPIISPDTVFHTALFFSCPRGSAVNLTQGPKQRMNPDSLLNQVKILLCSKTDCVCLFQPCL